MVAACDLLMDLTTLSSNDTDERVRRLCAKAINPLRPDIAEGLGLGATVVRPAAVCVYHPFVRTAVEALKGTGIHIAAVSTAFPHGLSPLKTRIEEIVSSVADGADEIDVVIPRGLVYEAKWQDLYDEIVAFRAACGEAHLKVILGTGDLSTLRNVMLASMVAMMAGADFVKTSTGKESVNATLPVGLAMVRSIRAYHERTGYMIGFKPAGGYLDRQIRTRLAGADEGGTRAALARTRAFPLWCFEPPYRHRTAARTSSDRPLLG